MQSNRWQYLCNFANKFQMPLVTNIMQILYYLVFNKITDIGLSELLLPKEWNELRKIDLSN